MKDINRPVLWIVVPCFNEEEVLPQTAPMLKEVLSDMITQGKIHESSAILFVNDGSSDSTWELIRQFAADSPQIRGISLSRNRGHQNALLAGLMEAKDKCDITISIDCDGQDDLQAMYEMVDKYREGFDIVYGVRSDRETDTWFKRTSAQVYYKTLNRMGAEVVYNHADYRLVSSLVLQEFSDFQEVNLFLRGLFPLVGFRSTCVYYSRHKRIAGKTHYSMRKMLALALDGITSLSITPIRCITAMGFVIAMLSFVGVIWAFVSYFMGTTVSGWASMTCVICFLGGIQLLALGVIGEYIGKTYLETKRRPRFIVSSRTWEETDTVPASDRPVSHKQVDREKEEQEKLLQ